MSIDTIGNFLTIIRNGVMISKSHVTDSYSKIKHEIAQILKDEGFIKNFVIEEDSKNFKKIKLFLKYVSGESVIHKIDRISTPGCRAYASIARVKPVIGGLGVTILTTNRGIMTHRKARELSVGGEVICTVW